MATYTSNYNLGKPDSTDPFKNFRQLFNDNMDKIDQIGGGSGDTVTWTQELASGTKIAQISINGNSQNVYAPSPPVKLSDLANDTGFITSTVSNLSNYYKKTETYTQSEVDALISAIVTLNIEVVSVLPQTGISRTTIYLIPKATVETEDIYDEYINLDGTTAGWERIGSTQIDLSNYYTKSEINALLAAKADISALASVALSGNYSDLNGKPSIPDELADLQSDSTHRTVTDAEKNAWNNKSNVSVEQVQDSGVKIAEIEIDGVSTDIYSPGLDVQKQINELLESIGILKYWADSDTHDFIVTHDGDYIGFRTENSILAYQ